MKTISAILFCLLTPWLLQANDILANHNKSLSWVDAQVQAIQVPRIGASDASIDSLNNPFIFTYTVKKNHKLIHVAYKHRYHHIRPLRLMLIINNKAMINNRWYNLNEKLRGYKITSITPDEVTLKNRYRVKILSLRKNRNNVKIHIK